MRIGLALDNHAAHVSKETWKYLATTANRFGFVLTPVPGSWLNVVKSFFSKATNSLLRDLRVETMEELKQRIERSIDRLNEVPVVYKWTYKIDENAMAYRLICYLGIILLVPSKGCRQRNPACDHPSTRPCGSGPERGPRPGEVLDRRYGVADHWGPWASL